MVGQCGYGASLGVGTMHELWDNGRSPAVQNWPASRNDLHNNREGRDCATNPDCVTVTGGRQSCHVCCSAKLSTGKLLY
jgi:hypothetical protein